MNFKQTPEFKKELKRLSKKWRSLPNDIRMAQRGIVPLYVEQTGVDIHLLRKSFFSGKRATILKSLDDGREVVKMRLDVESLGTRSTVRIVFVAVCSASTVLFIELYTKGEKDREDSERITKYL